MPDGQITFYETVYGTSGSAFQFEELTETDFAAATGLAYTPPEQGEYRVINIARTIQLLSWAPNVIETTQTTTAYLRLPCGIITTDDALPGRTIYIKNSGDSDLIIQDYSGTTLETLVSGYCIIAIHKDNDNWEIFYNTDRPPQDIISPTLSWGRSGTVRSGSWLQNETVPSNLTGRYTSLYNCTLTSISVSNENANTFDIQLYEYDGSTYYLLATISLSSQRSKTQIYSGVSITRGRELAIKVSSGSCKNPVVQVLLYGNIKS